MRAKGQLTTLAASSADIGGVADAPPAVGAEASTPAGAATSTPPDAQASGQAGTPAGAATSTPADAQASTPADAEAGGRERPLLLVDIDGVISLFGFERDARPAGSFHWVEGMPHFLSATAAEHLLSLRDDFELVWASGWEERANEHLPHLLGVPPLPHLRFERAVGSSNAHWKLDAIEAHAGQRALAWLDDSFNDACHTWARSRVAPTLLVQTAPAHGITRREVELLLDWARTHAPA